MKSLRPTKAAKLKQVPPIKSSKISTIARGIGFYWWAICLGSRTIWIFFRILWWFSSFSKYSQYPRGFQFHPAFATAFNLALLIPYISIQGHFNYIQFSRTESSLTTVRFQFTLVILLVSLEAVRSLLEDLAIFEDWSTTLWKWNNVIVFVAQTSITSAHRIAHNISNGIKSPSFRVSTRHTRKLKNPWILVHKPTQTKLYLFPTLILDVLGKQSRLRLTRLL